MILYSLPARISRIRQCFRLIAVDARICEYIEIGMARSQWYQVESTFYKADGSFIEDTFEIFRPIGTIIISFCETGKNNPDCILGTGNYLSPWWIVVAE